ncbi:hypothetical protein [Halopiger djelfimassiliensis]|uniref:hypothetical protein n=1 Tax=Halopiger djelfimassiliensis TaxID=1293047 RepID=UPI000AB474AE|nr:hypothetical protein [Halopiger djelfimassiliensis]
MEKSGKEIVLTTAFTLHDPLPYLVYGQVVVGVLLGAGIATVLNTGTAGGTTANSS